MHSLTTESAGIILSVAYNAIKVKYITRAQLSSASKTLKLGMKSTLSKEEYLVRVARALIKEGFIEFKASSKNITGDNNSTVEVLLGPVLQLVGKTQNPKHLGSDKDCYKHTS